MTRLLKTSNRRTTEETTTYTTRCSPTHFVLALVAGALVFLWSKEDQMLMRILKTTIISDASFLASESTTTTTTGTTTTSYIQSTWEPMSLYELTGGDKKSNCTWPWVPVDNIVVEGDPFVDHLPDGTTRNRKIPKLVHLAWISLNDRAPRQGRCLHYLQAEIFEEYKQSLPGYSVYFHDDDAVDELLQQKYWPEFPNLAQILQCCKMRGAMLVDIWRILILYRYGGYFADLDLWPTKHFTEELIPADVDFFCLSDTIMRPTQNSFAMAPGHPIGFTTMNQILVSMYYLDNIYNPPLVFTTGPDILAQGVTQNFFNHSRKKAIGHKGNFTDHYGTTALKLGRVDWEPLYVINMRSIKKTINGTEISYYDQVKKDTGILHWLEEKDRLSEETPQRMSCRHYLYDLERSKKIFPERSTAKLHKKTRK